MKKLVYVCSFVIFILAIWGCSNPSVSSTRHPVQAVDPTQTLPPTETSPASATNSQFPVTSEPSPTAEPSLSSTGPWLLFRIADELYISNHDGSAVVHLDLPDLWTDWSNTFVPSPDGEHIAIKSWEAGLLVLDLPEGSFDLIAPLINPEIEVTQDNYSFWDDSYASIYFLLNMSWSASGEFLAFVAMSEGETPDLYLLDFDTGQTERITAGDTIALIPEWSPNDEYILHDAVTSVYWGSSGRGYAVDSVWIAYPDGSIPYRLFESELSPHKGFEHRLGWLSNSVYIAVTEPEWCNQTNLRTVSLVGAPSASLWQGSFSDAVFDPRSETVLIFIPLEEYQWNNPGCPRSQSPGFYLLNLQSGTISIVEGFDLQDFYTPTITWSAAANVFIIENDNHLYNITPSGEVGSISSSLLGDPHVSRDGRFWAMRDLDEYPNSGIVLMTQDGHLVDIFEGEVESISWSPSSTHLFFTGKRSSEDDFYDLYVAAQPTFAAENLSERFDLPHDWRMSFLTWSSP